MKKLLIIISLFTSFSLLGEEGSSCFYTHVKDAIKLNRIRRGAYELETSGKSERVSRYLIFWEKLALMKAKKYDRWAQEFQVLGVPVLCEDLIDMAETPSYTPRTAQIPKPYLNQAKPTPRLIKQELRHKLDLGFIHLKEELETQIQKLSVNKDYDCLLRHLLESLLRTADLAPRYLSKLSGAKQKELESFLKRYLRLQIFGISQAAFIDKKARSLQSAGVPILCNDVPAVSLSPWQ